VFYQSSISLAGDCLTGNFGAFQFWSKSAQQQLLKPYQQYENLHYGEGVTELAHALQPAQLAHEANKTECSTNF